MIPQFVGVGFLGLDGYGEVPWFRLNGAERFGFHLDSLGLGCLLGFLLGFIGLRFLLSSWVSRFGLKRMRSLH